MKVVAAVLILGTLSFAGCVRVVESDTTPPGPPTGLQTFTGDKLYRAHVERESRT